VLQPVQLQQQYCRQSVQRQLEILSGVWQIKSTLMELSSTSFCNQLYKEMERDYEGEAYERGFKEGFVDGQPLGYEEGFREGFLAAIPIATELIQTRTRLEEVMSQLSSTNCHTSQNNGKIRHKALLLMSQLQRYKLENIEDTKREITLSSIKIKLKQLSIQAGLHRSSTSTMEGQEETDNISRTTSSPSDLSF
jgi:flagellar biosynthesis/type III secretory pathway protein FliH